MRIGIYADLAKEESPTGIGLHIRELMTALAEIGEEDEYLVYYEAPLVGRSGRFPVPGRPNFRARPVRFPAGWQYAHPTLWWDHYLPAIIRRDRLDVFHGPNHFLPAPGPARGIVTIHDLAYFKAENLYSDNVTGAYRNWTRKALDRADAVIALSENTRRDIEELGVPPDRVRVIYGGGHVWDETSIRYDRAGELRRALGLPGRYILFVGTIAPRKNVPFLLRAYARLRRSGGLEQKLVLAGGRGQASDEVDALIAELGLGGDVVVTGYVEDWQLPLLYRMADLFVLPTLYEGFTLVTLEAMAYGVPVIATDTSSIREGTGDAALLVPVGDTEGLAAAMRSALGDEALRQGMIARGSEQARKFTWGRCASETLALYREVRDGPGSRGARSALEPTVA